MGFDFIDSSYQASDIGNLELNSDFAQVLEIASDLNSHAELNAILEKEAHEINVPQTLETLSKFISIPTELKANMDSIKLKQILALNKYCQDSLLRPAGVERQQNINEKYSSHDRKEELLGLLDKLGVLGDRSPSLKEYDILLLNGASEIAVKERINYFLTTDTKISKSYLLGSDRKLWPLHEPMAGQIVADELGIPLNEVNAKFIEIGVGLGLLSPKGEILKEAQTDPKTFTELTNNFRNLVYSNPMFEGLKWPTEIDMMKKVCEEFGIKAYPVIAKQPVGKTRADTSDSFEAFLDLMKSQKMELTQSTILSVSNQPYVIYQSGPAEVYLGDKVKLIETIGKGADKDKVNIPIALDALARSIFVRLPMIFDKFLESAKEKAKPEKSWVSDCEKDLQKKSMQDSINL